MRALRQYGFLLLLALLAACGNDAAPLKGPAAVYTEVIQEVYIANFGRAADTAGLESFAGQLSGMGAAADIPNLNASYAGSDLMFLKPEDADSTPPKLAKVVWPFDADLVVAEVAVVEHLSQLGYPAAPRIPELRALWRRGPSERRLVSAVTTRWDVA